MPNPLSLKAYRDDLAQIVQSVFRTMMDMEVEPVHTPWEPSQDRITAEVQFMGGWHGATLVECCGQPARRFAQHFMGIPLPESIDDDVRDVMGELANMVAGNLKSLLPRDVDLSIPLVVEGSDDALKLRGGNQLEQSYFTCPAGNFCVTLVELLQPN